MEEIDEKVKQEGLLTGEKITSENSALDSRVQLKEETPCPGMEDDNAIMSDDPEIELNPPVLSPAMDDSTDCDVTYSMNGQSTSTQENAGGKNAKDVKMVKPSSRNKKRRCKKLGWNIKKHRSADALANLAYLRSIGVDFRKKQCREEAQRVEASMLQAMKEEKQAGADNSAEKVGQRGRAVAESAPEVGVPAKTKYRPWEKIKLMAATTGTSGTTTAGGGRRRRTSHVDLMPPKRRNAISAALARAKYGGWRKRQLQTSRNVHQDASETRTARKSYKRHGSLQTPKEEGADVVPKKVKYRPWEKIKLRAAQEALAAGGASHSNSGQGSRSKGRARSRGHVRSRGQSRGRGRGISWSSPDSSEALSETSYASPRSRRSSPRGRVQRRRVGGMRGSSGGRGVGGGRGKGQASDDTVGQAGELLSGRKRQGASVVAARAEDATLPDRPPEPAPKRQKRGTRMGSRTRPSRTRPRGRGGYRRGSQSGFTAIKVEGTNLTRPTPALQEQIERLRARGPTVDPSSHFAIPDQPLRQETRNPVGQPGVSTPSQPSARPACCCHSHHHQQMGPQHHNGPSGTSPFASVLARLIDDDISEVRSNQSYIMNVRLDVKKRGDAAEPSHDGRPSTSGGGREPCGCNGPVNQPSSTEVKREPAGSGTRTGGAGCRVEIRSGPGPSRAGNHQDSSASDGASTATNQANRSRSGRQGDSQQEKSSGEGSGWAMGILSDADLCCLLKARIQAHPRLSSSVRDNLVQSLDQTQRILASSSSYKSSSSSGSPLPCSGSSFFQGCVPQGPAKGSSSQGSAKMNSPSQNSADDDGPPDLVSENSNSANFNLQGDTQGLATQSSVSRSMPRIWNNGVSDDED